MRTKTTHDISEHTGKTHEFGGNTRMAIRTLSVPTLVKLADPLSGAGKTDLRTWEKRVDEHVKRGATLTENLRAACLLVCGQCTKAVQAKVKARDNHDMINDDTDVVGLLKSVKSTVFQFQSQKHAAQSLREVRCWLCNLSRSKDVLCEQCLCTFQNHANVLERCGGVVSAELGLVGEVFGELCPPVDVDAVTGSQIQAASEKAKQWCLACAFILGSNRVWCGKLIEDLKNSHTTKGNKFTPKLMEACDLLIHWKQDPKNLMCILGMMNDGVAFAAMGEDKMNKGGKKDKLHITCCKCGKNGHCASECKSKDGEEQND